MPADDVIFNLKQIAGYPPASLVPPNASIILQSNGLGSAYMSMSPSDFVGTALANGGDLVAAGKVSASSIFSPDGRFSSVIASVLQASEGSITVLRAGSAFVNNDQVLTRSQAVTSVNFKRGDVVIDIADITGAGGAPVNSPAFTGVPTAPTPELIDNSDRLATTMFVQQAVAAYIDYLLKTQPFVFSFNGRSGDVTLTAQDVIDAGGVQEIFDSPIFTGDPQTPTPPPGDDDNSVASTAFVQHAIQTSPLLTGLAPLASPQFTGNPTAPTAAPGSSTGQLATTAFVMNAVAASTAGVSSFNTRTGAVVLTAADITGAGGAGLASPAFTGTPTAPTAAPGTNSTQIATTAYVTAAIAGVTGGVTSFNTRTGAVTLLQTDLVNAGGALANDAALTGVPTAPTAPLTSNSTQIATTAFVQGEILNGAVASFNGRVGAVTLQMNDISAAGGAAINSPAFTGTPSAPTASPGTNTTQLATTAFVEAAMTNAGVTSFNTRSGAVTLTLADVTGAGGAPSNSPAFSGTPTAPTPIVGDSSQKIATTQFVTAALAGGAGVQSFNGRTGVVSLTGADVFAVGGAPLASPAFTGSPTSPTPAPGNNSTQVATTAFVTAAINASAVASFNGRTGAVTLQANDISAAGGALLASPALTGTPTAPTASVGTNTGQLATTAFVEAAVNAAGGVTSFNSRAGVVTLTGADISGAGGALLAGPAFTGVPTAPTATAGTNTTQLATTAFVTAAINAVGYLPLSGGTLTGKLTISSGGLSVTGSGVFTSFVQAGGNGIIYSGFNASHTYGISYNTSYGFPQCYTDGVNTGWFITSSLSSAGYIGLYSLLLNNAGNQITASYAGGSAYWSVTLSDRRLKSNLKLSTFDALAALRNLKVWDCDMRGVVEDAPKQHWDCALIADEVAPLIPRAFMKGAEAAPSQGDDKTPAVVYDGLDLLPMVATLVKAVQQLAARLDELTAPKKEAPA